MKVEDCPSFNDCSAPLCPLDGSLPQAVFYTDESVCNSKEFRSLQWVKIQRRIKKRGLNYKTTGYFTVEMLKVIKAVGKGLTGIDPNSRQNVEAWLYGRQDTRVPCASNSCPVTRLNKE